MTPPEPNPLRYGATLPIAAVDPLTRLWNEASSLVFSRPIAVDAFGELRGDLAESWEISPDRLRCRLHARSGVRWHDGEPFGAADLEFSLQLLADPANAGRVKPALPDVDDIARDGDDVVITLRRPVPGLVDLLAKTSVVPAHRHDATALLDGRLGDDPVGTGPYRLVERGEGTATFAAHAAHHGGRPAIGRIEMRHVANDTERAEAIAAGSLDIAQVKAQDLRVLTGQSGVTVTTVATRVWRALSLRLDHPLLRDSPARRGLSMLIDRDEVVTEALGGFGRPQYWPVPPGSWASPADPPEHGPEAAAAALRAAGWERDANGRWVADGCPVELRFCYLETETFRAIASRVIAAQFEAFGIGVTLEPITWEQYEGLDRTGLGTTPYAGIVVGWSGGVDPYENLASRFSSTGHYNREGYHDAELDELLLTAVNAPDRETAIERYRRVLDITHRDSIMVPLANPHYLFATRGVTGFEEFEVDSFYEFTQYAHLLRRNAAVPA